MDWRKEPHLGGKYIDWGKHKGSFFADLPEKYIRWLTLPIITDRATNTKKRVDVPRDITETAKAIVAVMGEESRIRKDAIEIFHGRSHEGPGPLYYLQFCGNAEHEHKSELFDEIEEALNKIEKIYPIRHEAEDGVGEVISFREAPDPENDQILIWEILPSGHRKVVWHFSGKRHQIDAMGPQGRLPSDEADLYTLALRE